MPVPQQRVERQANFEKIVHVIIAISIDKQNQERYFSYMPLLHNNINKNMSPTNNIPESTSKSNPQRFFRELNLPSTVFQFGSETLASAPILIRADDEEEFEATD